jgi:hypothetical protein
MNIISNNRQYYHIIEELKCSFNEKQEYIILKDDEIIYWQKLNNYYPEMKLNIEMMKEYIELIQYKNEERKQIILHSLKDTLNKMIAYKREIKINKIL